MPRSQWLLLCVTALAATACAPAAPPPTAAPPRAPAPADPRDDARALAERGVALYESGDYVAAALAFSMAYQRFHAPTVLLWLARSRERLGQLREAYEVYSDIVREEIKPYEPAPYHEAQQRAAEELAALVKRMPSVQIRVTGAPAEDVWVMIDGQIAAAPGDRVPLDPGRHEITADAPGRPALRREVVLEGASTKWVWLTLGTPASPTAAPARPTPTPQRPRADATPVPAAGPEVASPPEQ